MKRFHVHVAVAELAESVRFYSALFDAQPSVLKDDYAKWMLEDPRINFAVSLRGAAPGLDHLGFQADSEDELAELEARMQAAGSAIVSEAGTACCYAESNKHWAEDPSGIAWEAYHTLASIPTYKRGEAGAAACCAPQAGAMEGAAASAARCGPKAGCC